MKQKLFYLMWILACQTQWTRAPNILMSSEFRPPEWVRDRKVILDRRHIYITVQTSPETIQDLARQKGEQEILRRSVSLLTANLERETKILSKEHVDGIEKKQLQKAIKSGLQSVKQNFSQMDYRIERVYWEQKKGKKRDHNGLPIAEYHYYFLVGFSRVDYEAMIRTLGDRMAEVLEPAEFEQFKIVLFYLLTEEH